MSDHLGVDAPKRSRTAPRSGDQEQPGGERSGGRATSRPTEGAGAPPPRRRTGADPDATGEVSVATSPESQAPTARGRDATTVTGGGPSTTGSASDASGSGEEAQSPLDAVRAMFTARPRGPIKARRVHRIVRRIDPWSVLKLSLLFYFSAWIISMVALVLMWGVAVGSGTVESLENAVAEILAFEELRFNGDQLFQLIALGGLIGVFVATAISAILAVLFNLIANLTGGIRTTVIEEETARRVLREH